VNNNFAVAIDGPVGVGKSTTARLTAKKLGFTYIDTGAMYRAVALYMLENGINLHDNEAVSSNLNSVNIFLKYEDGFQKIYLNNKDITNDIRTQTVSEGASVVGSHPKVREKLVAEQKKLAETGFIVMDGRDIGSYVIPWAQVKIYLDAAQEIRARRRVLDLEAKNQPADFREVLDETKIRDHRDKTRETSPLIQTKDAILIDTGLLTLEEVIDKIVSIVNVKLRERQEK